MPELSRYVDYLPPVLWSREYDPSQFTGRMLRIFEHLLTGIPADGPIAAEVVAAEADVITLASAAAASQFSPSDVVSISGTPERGRIRRIEAARLHLMRPLQGRYRSATLRLTARGSIESQIDRMAELFDPWRTPPQFLPWLASWVALDIQPDWNDYQTRKFIADIVPIYQQRGLKAGLLTYLDIYATTKAKPRIAIDDGEALIKAAIAPSGMASLYSLAFSHTVDLPGDGEERSIGVLLHPTAVAVGADGSYFVVDAGAQERFSSTSRQWPPALWKLSSAGEVPYSAAAGELPRPQPLYAGDELTRPTAVTLDRQGHCYVLTIGTTSGSRSQRSALHEFAPPHHEYRLLIGQQPPALPAIHPVDLLLLEGDDRRFLILDRGTHNSRSTAPQLVTVRENPLRVETRSLPELIEPMALAQDPVDGQIVIADAREPSPTEGQDQPVDFFRLNPDTGALTSLLGDVSANPLIFPTGIVFERHQVLVVCDCGVRNRESGIGNLVRAESATLYRVDLSQTPPTITRITSDRRMVYPTKIAQDRRGNFVITDQGTFYEPVPSTHIEWRSRANTFGLSVLFSQERPTERTERNRIRFDISQLVEAQKPGHTAWWLDDRILPRLHVR